MSDISRKTKRVTFRLTATDLAALRDLAARRGLTVSGIVNLAVAKVLSSSST